LGDCFGAFADSSLPIGLFRLTALAFSLISACFLASLGAALALSLIPACLSASSGDCFGDFFYFSLLIGLFG
jgi:hypothetical protein